jgi:hypothetical protein
MGRMPLSSIPKCRVCGVELLVDANWQPSRHRTNKRICKECNNACTRNCEREWRERDPGRVKERSWYKRGIFITFEEYTKKNLKQEGRCTICGKVPKNRPLVPDHNHTTGQLRDLLCTPCNTAIWALECALTPQFQSYLEKWKTE